MYTDRDAARGTIPVEHSRAAWPEPTWCRALQGSGCLEDLGHERVVAVVAGGGDILGAELIVCRPRAKHASDHMRDVMECV
jgi:hypothetical protein